MPVVILSAGIIHKVGPSRVSVELSRRLAGEGHVVLRFDLSGIGDSPRVPGRTLEATVEHDIRDAVSLVLERAGESARGACLIGFCSGADNAFYAARGDPRVSSLVLMDGTVHATPGSERRWFLQRLQSPRSWWNVVSGRSMWLRLRSRLRRPEERPPGYYGLLTQSPQEADETARELVDRDVQLLYVLTSGAGQYCNSPDQVSESLPTGYSADHFSIEWRPEMDHLLSSPAQRTTLADVILEWLCERVERAGADGPDPSVSPVRSPS